MKVGVKRIMGRKRTMKIVQWAAMGCVVLVTGVGHAWTDLGGGDHGGSNWVITGGTTIASNHYNLGTLSIATGATVMVKAWDGTKYGGLDVVARDIRIEGVLDATGGGYGGGNGGAGGAGSTTVGGTGGAGLTGAAGSGPHGGIG